jgi:predicted dehydrogenase
MTKSYPILTDLRFGVIGFGKLVRDYYLPAFRGLSGAKIVAVADPLEESRSAAAERLPGAEVFCEHREMLEKARIEGVLIASPPSTHLQVWSDTTAEGLPTFVEKPLVLSSQLAGLAIRSESRVMINFNRRFWPTYGRVRDLVRHGILGTPVHLEFLLHLDVLQWSRVTRHRLEGEEGGVLNDLGCHAIDLALDIIGEEPSGITAIASSRRWRDDQFQLRLDFPSGSSADCDLAYGGRTREALMVRGPKKTVSLADPNKFLHVVTESKPRNFVLAWSLDTAAIGYRACSRSQSMGRASIRGSLAAFIHSLRAGLPYAPGFEDGIRNARWVAAAARSSRTAASSMGDSAKATAL